VVHGGIQAALLDEVMGVAAHRSDPSRELDVVTADFRLRFQRPTPSGVPLRVRARIQRVEGRDYFLEGEIVGPDEEVLTRAEARWRRIERRPRPAATS
jgi:uncharacterized protein (TIGR00369 family)